MPGRYTLDNYSCIKNRDVFFDANIILYLYWPTDNRWWIKEYSTLFRKLLTQGNKMYINFLVISEVVNRAMRIEHDKYNKIKSSSMSYKEYRDSESGMETLEDIYTILEDEILSRFNIVDDSFDRSDIVSFLNVDNLDFGDKAHKTLPKKILLLFLIVVGFIAIVSTGSGTARRIMCVYPFVYLIYQQFASNSSLKLNVRKTNKQAIMTYILLVSGYLIMKNF